eukprot:GEMP01042414.1.p1 GENE.GEMP01042414.1~~GEMP01042414.1.p1  ORF type:complete len:326 (-),score=50.81 GEMP01042414.1:867-1751(-)
MISVGKLPPRAREFFGWRLCPNRRHVDRSQYGQFLPMMAFHAHSVADGVESPDPPQYCGHWPLAHIGARVVTLLYLVIFHAWQTSRSEDDGGGLIFWRDYLLHATKWALFLTLLYFVLITVATAQWPPSQLFALLAPSTQDDATPDDEGVVALPAMLRACSACLYLAVVLQLFATFMFWSTFPFSHSAQQDFANDGLTMIQTHGVVCVCVCAELFLTHVPIFAKDAWLVALAYVAYMTLNVSYTLITGSPVYDYFTWKDWQSFVVAGGGTVLLGLCVGIVQLFDRWRQSGRKIS